MTPQILAVAIFVAAYLAIVAFYDYRTLTVWVAVAVLLLTGTVTLRGAFEAINWNVVFLYVGMLFVSEAFLNSRMPDYLATHLVAKAGRVGTAMLLLCLLTGALSMALENVAVVLLMAPVALAISRRCGVAPGPLFVGMAVSSNLQGAATLIGDPPSMLLAGFTGMDFNDFFFFHGKPALFFAVQAGAVVSSLVLALFLLRHRLPVPPIEATAVRSKIPTFIVVLLVASLIAASSFLPTLPVAGGLVCLFYGALSAIWLAADLHRAAPGEAPARRRRAMKALLKLDWQSGLFLVGVFVLVSGLTSNGIMQLVASFILKAAGTNVAVIYLLVVGVSVAVSAFVDNVPFLIAMLPVLQTVTQAAGADPYLFYFGLLIGASVGGNITPVGASANIVAMGIVKREGYRVRFFEFVKIGLPFTVAAVAASAGYLWLLFSP